MIVWLVLLLTLPPIGFRWYCCTLSSDDVHKSQMKGMQITDGRLVYISNVEH